MLAELRFPTHAIPTQENVLLLSDATARTPAISMHRLSRRYGDRFAVRDVDIDIPRGVVAGLVGPNGSGKTTTIRMLLGLVRPTSGSAEVLGVSIKHPRTYLPRVGALIESPAFYPSLSGRSNLQVLTRLGGFPKARIDSLIAEVGLEGRDRDRVSTYSLGMRQRLGVAAALLPDPDLLILDEPSNGLDPPGIIEMRELVRRLRDQGRTVFVSSHLLGEMEQVAGWLVVLKEGRSVFAGTMADVLAARQGGIEVAPERPDQIEVLRELLHEQGFATTPRGERLLVVAGGEAAAGINRRAAAAGIVLAELHAVQSTLEETFLSIIGST